ncbi:MAG: hypothetical protein QM764_06405 [Chitinophagaceae bacterium]
MTSTQLFFRRLLPVALALGTAWAARGQIGHEYGAAWAGSIGVIFLVAISGRKDWYYRLPAVAAMAAIAWGVSGIMSYGKVVGYGQAPDFVNTSYGLLMLMLIGGLYGFIGGGVTGLTLESTTERKANIPLLITEMVAGGFLFWGFLIYQLEWFMTPPRSELWAACLGAAFALGWYLYRNGYSYALRTAFFSALGAGFGFAFGNFLQRMGRGTGIDFNWWNVMEYSIGFFAGLGLAYGVFSKKDWPQTIVANKASNTAGWIFLILLLPAINLIEGMNTKSMIDTANHFHFTNTASFAFSWQVTAWILSVVVMIALCIYFQMGLMIAITRNKIKFLAFVSLTWYILISNFIGATWLVARFSSQHLYWVNLLAVIFMLSKNENIESNEIEILSPAPPVRRLVLLWTFAILLVLTLSFIAVSAGNANPKAQLRF